MSVDRPVHVTHLLDPPPGGRAYVMKPYGAEGGSVRIDRRR
jgi:hypothetical protein